MGVTLVTGNEGLWPSKARIIQSARWLSYCYSFMNYTASWRLSWEIEKEKEINVCIQPISFLDSNIYNAQLWVFVLSHSPNDGCHHDLDKTNGALSIHTPWEFLGLMWFWMNEWVRRWMDWWKDASYLLLCPCFLV